MGKIGEFSKKMRWEKLVGFSKKGGRKNWWVSQENEVGKIAGFLTYPE